MSYAWGILLNDKDSLLMGSILWGLIITLLVGIPIWLLLNYFGETVPIWMAVIFGIIVMPIVTFLLYKSGCKKLEK